MKRTGTQDTNWGSYETGERVAEGLLMKGFLYPADEFILCVMAIGATKGF